MLRTHSAGDKRAEMPHELNKRVQKLPGNSAREHRTWYVHCPGKVPVAVEDDGRAQHASGADAATAEAGGYRHRKRSDVTSCDDAAAHKGLHHDAGSTRWPTCEDVHHQGQPHNQWSHVAKVGVANGHSIDTGDLQQTVRSPPATAAWANQQATSPRHTWMCRPHGGIDTCWMPALHSPG